MTRQGSIRYGDVAIGFHWLIAVMIFGLLAVGKYMTGLEADDPIRFALTQWHKTFGITVLLLSVLRLAWRLGHRPPPDPEYLPNWQRRIAHLVHLGLYALLFAAPVTGWMMVSASPLGVPTLLFDVIPWPHLPLLPDLANKKELAELFHEIHEIASNLMLLLLLAHVGAALKHHFIDKDTVLQRMLPVGTRAWYSKLAAFGVAVAAAGIGLYFYANADKAAALLAAGDSEISFIADVTGDATPGYFAVSVVEAVLDESNPAASQIEARVETAGVSSDNIQMAESLPDADWFDSEAHPEATFVSTAVRMDEPGQLLVDGTLTIKGFPLDVSFPMTLSDEPAADGGTGDTDTRVATGEFTVDRRAFELGLDSQSTDDFVGWDVIIKFRFDISPPAP